MLTIVHSPQYKRLAAVQGDLFFQAPRRFFMQAMSRTQKTYAFSESFTFSRAVDVLRCASIVYKRGNVMPFPFLGAFHISDIPEFYGTVSISGTPPDFIGTDALGE